MRIFTVSDIHIDYVENKNWLLSLSQCDYVEDILIFSGDISHDIFLIELAFKTFSNCFKEVYFVPGNHDLWVKCKEDENSFERFSFLIKLATQYGISTCYKVFEKFAIIPILSWYDFSFGEPEKRLLRMWGDFVRCDWKDMEPKQINEYFLQKNIFPENLENKKIVSFSHFLPRIDVMPHGRKLTSFLAPVLGSKKLDVLIRKWPTNIHIYGHSHVNSYIRKENILYINNAFGYPSETHITSKKLLDITYDVNH